MTFFRPSMTRSSPQFRHNQSSYNWVLDNAFAFPDKLALLLGWLVVDNTVS